MAADPSGPDPKSLWPKALWQDQEQEPDPVSLEQVHALVRRYDRKMRFVPLMVAVCLVIVGLIGGNLWVTAQDTLDRALAVLFILGEAGAFVIGYRVAFPGRDPAESAAAYLRRRLRMKLAHARGRWMVMLAPVAPFFSLFAYKAATHPPARGPHLPQIAPLAVLVAVWLVAFLIMKRKAEPEAKAQLDELETLMGR
jgi:hypothetical protein